MEKLATATFMAGHEALALTQQNYRNCQKKLGSVNRTHSGNVPSGLADMYAHLWGF
jgi:hypothetical protein